MISESFVDETVSEKPLKTLEDLLERVRRYYPNADLSIIEKAYRFGERAHAGQIRRSGEPYIFHPLSVAGILAELRLDLASIATGLLHDVVEDTPITLDEIKQEFGELIAQLVDGVTKISKMSFRNTHEKQGENIRKMIVAMGKDVRVLMVKLADRLHNMRTLNHMPYEKQALIAQETLDIYAPLAGRMGISSLKIELEDLSFRYYRPDKYYELVQKIQKQRKERYHYIEEVKRLLSNELGKAGFKSEVLGRSKHLWSIYRKMINRDMDFEQIHDILAFRVLVDTVGECYGVLGHVHSLWKPIPGRFKDFIAMPKANNYQSLHTTVIGPGGERIEIQIRTRDMNLVAEKGIAAHWKYKEQKSAGQISEQFNWLRDLVSMHQQVSSSNEFLETVKTDLFDSEIYVFTPKGEVKELPEKATPIDFAYSIHTGVGNTCVGARVNGKIVQLKHILQNGDTVEVLTSKTQKPSKDWLKMCVTTRAKSKIRAFVKEEQRRMSQMMGRDLVEKEFRKYGLSVSRYLKADEFEKYLKDFGVKDFDDLCVKVGYGKLEPKHLVERVAPNLKTPVEMVKNDQSFLDKVFKSAAKKNKSNSLVIVEGMEDVLVHYGRCCNPIPGDPIISFISRGRGITVHRADCGRAFAMDQERRVEVRWNKASDANLERSVRLMITSQDTPGLLKLMSEAFAVQGININNANIRTTKDKKAVCLFDLSVRDASQLQSVIFELQKIRGIMAVERITQK
jgi:guanosine-3',5'-bis(diphosphate) 3'-pyrophosphohydrolase